MNPFVKYGIYAVSALALLAVVSGCFYTIDEGERGVVLRFSSFQKVAEPGLGVKIPFIERVQRVSIREHVVRYGSEQDPKTDLQSYSFDQQPAGIRVSVNYTVPAGKVEEVYRKFRTVENMEATILSTRILKATKEVFGRYTATKAIQDRTKLGADITERLQELVGDEPIVIIAIQAENVDFSGPYEESIEARMQAEIEVQKITQNALGEKVKAQITVIQAQAAADAVVAGAKASAESTRLKGDAEASAIRAKGLALADNPALVALVSAEKWNGVLPTTMIPSSVVPFVDVSKKELALPAKE